MKRHAWVVTCNGRIMGVALRKDVAEQAVRNCQRYARATGSKDEYEVTRALPVYTKRFVAPKGYDRENGVKKESA